MKHALLDPRSLAIPLGGLGFPARWARGLLLRRLADLRGGRLTFVEGAERYVLGEAGGDFDVTLSVKDPGFWLDVALGGSIGAGEAYVDGGWEVDDLTDLVRLLARNTATLDRMDRGLGTLRAPLYELYHRTRRNTREGSQRNISEHYDLGNDFFALFLDETMTYSAALFARPEATLREAQLRKLERLCDKLDLQPGDRVLEIGTGWGSFALYAAGQRGCHVTTTTLSARQAEEATARVRAAGLEDRVTVLLTDYRDLCGQFDKLVSIEMIEAVGHEYLPRFFERCADLLEPDGLFGLQAILLPEHRYEQARRSTDFIKRHIFPGSQVPSLGALADAWGRGTDFRLLHFEELTPHYARTLAAWRRRLRERRADARALGYSERLLRRWDFYFAYCEGGFRERSLGDGQLVLGRTATTWTPPAPDLGG